MIRVVIADDHQLVRQAWNRLLSRDKRLSIVAECKNGEEVIEVCKTMQPHVVLMDINMEPVDGIEATRMIRAFSDDIRIIGISVHSDLPYVNALMQAGANGYVTKNSSGEEMIHAIFLVLEGETYYCKEVSAIVGN